MVEPASGFGQLLLGRLNQKPRGASVSMETEGERIRRGGEAFDAD